VGQNKRFRFAGREDVASSSRFDGLCGARAAPLEMVLAEGAQVVGVRNPTSAGRSVPLVHLEQ
jgi:hypothetical protein